MLHLNTIPERFELVLAEANAAGVPVIAIDKGSCREIIANGTTGLLVNDVAEAVQVLERTSEINPATCREHVERNFSIEKMVGGYEAAYTQLLATEFARST